GERLNMAFGEDSFLATSENGNDMIWNPSSRIYTSLGQPVFAGKHYVYVFRNRDNTNALGRYDGGANIESLMKNSGEIKVWRSCTWVFAPLLEEGFDQLATDVRFTINLSKRHEK